MAVIDTGTDTAGKANVDANFNLNVVTPQDPTQAGAVILAGATYDANGVMQSVEAVEVTADGQIPAAVGQLMFEDAFNMAAQNTALWKAVAATQTIVLGSGFLTLNNSALITGSTSAAYQTYRSFPTFVNGEVRFTTNLQLSQVPQVNDNVEFGLFNAVIAGLAAPTDGVMFRYNVAAELRGIVNVNGTELQTGVITAPSASTSHEYTIVIRSNKVSFYIDQLWVAEVPLMGVSAFGQAAYAPAAPITFRHYIPVSTPALAQVVKITNVSVHARGASFTRDWPSAMVGMGRMASQGQNGGTMGSSALFTNSLAIGAGAAMTNTTAALGAGLGGQFTTTPTLAVPTDGIICAFTVPTPLIGLTGRALYITGVHIDAFVSATLTGGPVTYIYSLAYGSTAISLATGEAAGTKAPRRVVLGVQNFAAAAPAPTMSGNPIHILLGTPICVQPGELVELVAKNVGVVTTVGTITFLVDIDGYYE